MYYSKTSISTINKYMQKAKEPENDAGFLKHNYSQLTSQHTLLIDRSIVAMDGSIDFCASIDRSIDCIRNRSIVNVLIDRL